MQRLALSGHYQGTVELDLCPACDMVWFDLSETARLSGPGLLALIDAMARSHALPHELLRADARCPRCAGALRTVQNRSRWGQSSQLQCVERDGAYQSFAQFLQEKGLLRPMSRLDRAKLLRDKGRIDCVNCGAALAVDDERCSFCRSVPSLLDVARLARAVDPSEALERQAVHGTPERQSALQCAACGAAQPRDEAIRCSQCGATLAISNLAEANASVQALAQALRAAHEKPPPHLVKRRLDALSADIPRRREWAAEMEIEAQPRRGADAEFEWGSLLRPGTNPLRAVLLALAIWFAWRYWG